MKTLFISAPAPSPPPLTAGSRDHVAGANKKEDGLKALVISKNYHSHHPLPLELVQLHTGSCSFSGGAVLL